jgi:hypothetical protein
VSGKDEIKRLISIFLQTLLGDFTMAAATYNDAIQKLYIAFYQRAADVNGQAYWANAADQAGGDLTKVINAFATSAEATANYGSSNVNQQVNAIYSALFGRAPDATGLNYYSNAVSTGAMTLGGLALNVLNGATGTDATIVANKLAAANAFTSGMDTSAKILSYTGATPIANAKNYLASVTSDTNSVTNATSQVASVIAANVAGTATNTVGTIFTFTAGNNDAFTGSANYVNTVYGTQANINVGDVVNGGAGKSDKLVLTTNGTLNLATAANISGFEKLTLADGGNTVTLNSAMESSSLATLTNGNYSTITGGNGYDTIVTNNASQVVNLATVTGIEAIDLSALTSGNTTALTFAGGALANTVVTSTNAAAAGTGNNLTITMADVAGNSLFLAGAGTKTVVGGATSSNDKVTLVASQAGSAVTINQVETVVGSSATTDSVTMAAGSTTSVSLSGVETVTGGTGAQTITFTGTGAQTYVHAAGGLKDTLTLSSTETAVDTVKVSGLEQSTAAGAITVTAITNAGVAMNADMITVNNFAVANDKITLADASAGAANTTFGGTTAGTAAGATIVAQAVSTTGALAMTNTADIVLLNFDMGGTNGVLGGVANGSALLANLGGALTTAGANQKGYIMAYDNGTGYLYAYNDMGNGAGGAANSTITAEEITLIGTFNSVATGTLTTANFNIA